MKLVILTQYFPPEVGAPQNRLYELAVRLRKSGVQVSVLTAMPNYPKMEIHPDYKGLNYCLEEMEGMQVHRARIYVSKSKSVLSRLMNYFSFVFSSLFYGLVHLKRQDILLVESPPLFLGATAWLLAKAKHAKMVFNVSDLWPESAEKLGIITNRTLLKAASILEEFCYRKASLISGQTQGIVSNISSRFPNKKVYWLKNGVDISLFTCQGVETKGKWRKENGYSGSDFLVFYGGIIGYAQGLDTVLEAAKELEDYPNIRFVLMGEGPEKARLLEKKAKLGLGNLDFYPAVAKSRMKEIIADMDAGVVPLRRLDLFKGAIPSKIFELLAMQKPIVLGVEGEAKELFIDQGGCGVAFEPENSEQLAEAVRQLASSPERCHTLGANGLKYASENFNRDTIAKEFYRQLQQLI